MGKGDTCDNGIYVAESDRCFKYEVLRQVCMMVRF
jgi:hypothetical protein